MIRNKSLVHIASERILIASLLALLIQTAICLFENFSDDYYFANWFIDLETSRLSEVLSANPNAPEFNTADALSHYFGKHAAGYGFIILDARRTPLFSQNTRLFQSVDKSISLEKKQFPDRWLTKTSDSSRFEFSGGRKVQLKGQTYWIEVATAGDPANQRFDALWLDLVEDVFIPVIPTILLVAGFAIIYIRIALQPLAQASRQADQIIPGETAVFSQQAAMPLEAVQFCNAIQRLLERDAELISKQRFFVSRTAHELRTPLAIMTLELGKMQDERARRMEGDVSHMTHTVNQMITLASLDIVETSAMTALSLPDIVSDVMQQLQPIALDRSTTLENRQHGAAQIRGVASVIREAVINLIENAIKHGPDGNNIRVTCGPGAALCIEDGGPGFGDQNAEELTTPFARGKTKAEGAGLGLSIIARAAAMHGARLQFEKSALGGAKVTLNFANQKTQSPPQQSAS